MGAMWVLEHGVPGLVKPEQLNLLSVCGALIVVAGSMMCALANAASKPAEALSGASTAEASSRSALG